MDNLCIICKGKGLCGKPCRILAKFKSFKRNVTHFSGSAPEIFVGRHGYPQVFGGILSPDVYGDTEKLSMPESWFRENADIEKILQYRSQLIYTRFKIKIKTTNKMVELMKEVALASKPVATEFFLYKKPSYKFSLDTHMPVIGNPAPLKKASLEENPKVEKKVDYLIYDTDLKATHGVNELYKADIEISNIIKILASGQLGLKMQRKLVPSRWATTAVDDITSKSLLKEIKTFPLVNDFELFHSEYVGNHYEILLLPSAWAFEVIEAKMPGSVWNPNMLAHTYVAKDYENYFGRKDYASEVTGAYYSNRLAVCEYLSRIRRQASCLVMRECRPEYFAPCGVGILREASRNAFTKHEKFNSMAEAFQSAQKRMKLPVSLFIKNSSLLAEFKRQKKLSEFL